MYQAKHTSKKDAHTEVEAGAEEVAAEDTAAEEIAEIVAVAAVTGQDTKLLNC